MPNPVSSAVLAYLAIATLINWLLYRAARESIRGRRARRAARVQAPGEGKITGARVFRLTRLRS